METSQVRREKHGRMQLIAITFLTLCLLRCGSNPVPASESPVAATLTYSASTLIESSSNNGSFSDTIDVSLSGGNFALTSGSYIQGSHFSITSGAVPSGLTLQVQALTATTARISFTGNAVAHQPDDVTDIDVSFAGAAFESLALPTDGSNATSVTLDFRRNTVVLFEAGQVAGNLGGRAGADSLCSAAKPSGVAQPNIRAFVSVSSSDQISDMPSLYQLPTDFPVVTEAGSQVAGDWSDFIDDTIAASLQSLGVAGSGTEWWSGSLSDGSESAGNHCMSWTSSSGSDSAATGLTNNATGFLTGGTTDVCSSNKYLLCLAFD